MDGCASPGDFIPVMITQEKLSKSTWAKLNECSPWVQTIPSVVGLHPPLHYQPDDVLHLRADTHARQVLGSHVPRR